MSHLEHSCHRSNILPSSLEDTYNQAKQIYTTLHFATLHGILVDIHCINLLDPTLIIVVIPVLTEIVRVCMYLMVFCVSRIINIDPIGLEVKYLYEC